jgi:hypothetical protein
MHVYKYIRVYTNSALLIRVSLYHMLNMELDLQSYLGYCVQLYSLAETQPLPPPPAFGLIYEIDDNYL